MLTIFKRFGWGRDKDQDSSGLDTDLSSPYRPLSNPRGRFEIPVDFPATAYVDKEGVLPTLHKALEKRGMRLEDLPRINVAYPHKDPRKFPGYDSQATPRAFVVAGALRTAFPKMECVMTDGIVDTVHLGRSENQASLHALTRRQIYTFYPDIQKQPLPFVDPGNKEKEYFVIADRDFAQGTTVANMMNFIKANGGEVLAVFASAVGRPVAQRREAAPPDLGLPGIFTDTARNNGRAPALAAAFARSAARKGWSPAHCLELFEKALNRRGNSILALTDGECERLLDSLQLKGTAYPISFTHLMAGLNRDAGLVP